MGFQFLRKDVPVSVTVLNILKVLLSKPVTFVSVLVPDLSLDEEGE